MDVYNHKASEKILLVHFGFCFDSLLFCSWYFSWKELPNDVFKLYFSDIRNKHVDA